MSLQGRLAHFGAPGARRGVRGARPARPPRLVSGTSTSMGGFPFRERGSGVSNRYNLDYVRRSWWWCMEELLRLFLTKVATAGIAKQNPHVLIVDLGYSFQID